MTMPTARPTGPLLRRSCAAQALNHGDSIVIGPGTYKGPIFLAERFSADQTVEMRITGDESGQLTTDAPGAVIIEANSPTEPALHLFRFDHARIEGITFRGAGQGLKLEKCRWASVERCSFFGPSRGLAVSASDDVRVHSSVFSRCTIGLFLQSSVNVVVAHTTVVNCSSVGVVALTCGKGGVLNSILADNNTNLIADDVSAKAFSSDYNVIQGTNGPWGSVPAIAKVHEWASASGQDRGSVYIVPSFANPEQDDFHIQAAVAWPGGLPGFNVGCYCLAGGIEYDRDGKRIHVRGGWTCAGAYTYPDATPAPGWTKLKAVIEDENFRQSAGIYRQDGTLVRSLFADATRVRDLYWDGLDDLGQPAPAGKYVLKAVSHNVRLVDDGGFGDNGNPMGAYNCDNADRVIALPGGGFIVTTVYDEAGYALRRYSLNGPADLRVEPRRQGFRGAGDFRQ